MASAPEEPLRSRHSHDPIPITQTLVESQRDLAHALDRHEDAVLTFCQDQVRVPTENPPGNHYRECAERLWLELDRLRLDYRVVEVAWCAEEANC